MNASGIDDITILGPRGGSAVDVQRGLLPGLLVYVRSPEGAQTWYQYTTVQREARRASLDWPEVAGDLESGEWKNKSPAPSYIVKTVSTAPLAPGSYSRNVTSTFSYRDAVFDSWRSELRGFRRTQVRTGSRVVDTRFLFGGCQVRDGVVPGPSLPVEEQCLSPDRDPFDAVNGLPYRTETLGVETAGAEPIPLSTVHRSYRVVTQQGGARWLGYPFELNTFLYDTSNFTSSPSEISLYSTQFVDGATTTTSVPLRGPAVRLRSRLELDAYGYPTHSWDDGRVGLAGDAIDRPIHTVLNYTLVSQSGVKLVSDRQTLFDAGGTVQRIGPDAPSRRTFFDYDARGRLYRIKGIPNGALTLSRFHEAGSAIAPEPTTALKPTDTSAVVFATYTYDGYGNVARRTGAAKTSATSPVDCTSFSYDSVYQDLPTQSLSYAGACAASFSIARTTGYDRGLGQPLFQGGTAVPADYYYYDSFGRLIRSARSPINADESGARTTVQVEYADPDVTNVRRIRTTRFSLDGNRALVGFSYIDAFGATLATLVQADPGVGDGGDWVVTPGPYLNEDGQVTTEWAPHFWSGDGSLFPVGTPFGLSSVVTEYEYDPFARVRRVRKGNGYPGRLVSQVDYGPLSRTDWDANALDPSSSQYGKFRTTELSGHGWVERTSNFDDLGYTETTTYDHSAFGDVTGVHRTTGAPSTSPAYVRWLRYDAFGHVVENAEPNTADGFTMNYASAGTMKAWRYAYDHVGRLVGTRDARGCGKNVQWDGFSRKTAEDFSPCKTYHPSYTSSAERVWTYDTTESGQTTDYGWSTAYLRGRLAAYRDRGTWNRYGYDDYGRQVSLARRVTAPRGVSSVPANVGFDGTWFRKTIAYDGFDRVASETTGAVSPALLGVGGLSAIDYDYSERGLLKRVGSSYGDLVPTIQYDAFGRVTRRRYGDSAETATTLTYDTSEQRLSAIATLRENPGFWAAPPDGYAPPGDAAGTQSTIQNQTLTYDGTGHVRGIDDLRTPDEWPAGAKPVSRAIEYDSEHRVSGVTYQHGSDEQVSPFLAEESSFDPRPFPRTVAASRVGHQLLSHDFLGNLDVATADLGEVVERGFGSAQISATAPHQLVRTTSIDGLQEITPHYDAAGQVVGLDVSRVGTCSAPTGKCAQRMLFEWDEVGELTRARRWDMASLQEQPPFPAVPNGAAAAEALYRYSDGQRVHKELVNPIGPSTYTVDVFGSLRLKDTSWLGTQAYAVDASVEQVNLGSLARVVSRAGLPSTTGDQHTLLMVPDHLGSTSTVIDKGTSEIVEMITYLPHGGTETDLRSERWQSLREDLRFTGREEDVEFGIVAMGMRPYSPLLGRFLSPDPVTIHGVSGDLNPYGYAYGQVFNLTDPMGLDPCMGNEDCRAPYSYGVNAGAVIGWVVGAVSGFFGGGQRQEARPGAAAGVPAPPPPIPAAPPGVGASGAISQTTQALQWLDDKGAFAYPQAYYLGLLHMVPLVGLPGVPGTVSVADGLGWAGIKSDQRARWVEHVAAFGSVVALGQAGGALEGAAEIATEGAAAEGGSVGAMRRYIFEASPKHPMGVAPRPGVSPGPANGQAALDSSVGVGPNTARRVGIDYEAGEFTVFDETHPGQGIFHGHVRPWSLLDPKMQNALIRAGMANRRGVILMGD